MYCVSWWEAEAFCIWDGGFLPTALESLYVAAGGDEQRQYPWGGLFPGFECPGAGCDHAIFGCLYPSGVGICSGRENIANVGYAVEGATRWGQLDMVGNASHWVLDGYVAGRTPPIPCDDCAEPSDSSGYRRYRGSNFKGNAVALLSTNGGYGDTDQSGPGIRCARSPR